MDTKQLIHNSKTRVEQEQFFVEQIRQLAERQINVLQVSTSIGEDGNTETWAIVEFSIGNGKWCKFPIRNDFGDASDFIEYIIKVVHHAREKMSIRY